MDSHPTGVPGRANSGWLSQAEQDALEWLAPRVPARITADQLTAVGLAGAFLALLGYAMAAHHPVGLWLVNLGLVINWFGDSLDGTVARLRHAERPRYGFFLDQSTDVISQLLFALGLAASGLVRAAIVAAGFAVYLMMTVQSLLRAQVTGTFHLATGGIGLTEIRCLFFVANVAFYFVPPTPFQIGPLSLAYSDLLGISWVLVNLGLYLRTMMAELKDLARQEPVPPRNDSKGRHED